MGFGELRTPEPPDARFYAWEAFNQWCDTEGVGHEFEEDWTPWWQCWKRAIRAALHQEA